jgi:hypothetical protein
MLIERRATLIAVEGYGHSNHPPIQGDDMTPREHQFFLQCREALIAFYRELRRFIAEQGPGPKAGSKALQEQATSRDPESITTAIAVGGQLVELGSEHITAFLKSITEPVEPLACLTCVRSMLEPCALAAWLLDPTINAKERVGRTFGYRLDGFKQQRSTLGAAGAPASQLKEVEDRRVQVERDAIKLGYVPQGKKKGISHQKPGATEVIRDVLDMEFVYRLLSAVTHGHSWAIHKLV